MATSTDLILAAKDTDLLDRVKALLAVKISNTAANQNTDSIAESVMKRLVGVSITEDNQTIADVYAYKVATTPKVLPPGKDPSAVTDDQIVIALTKLNLLD